MVKLKKKKIRNAKFLWLSKGIVVPQVQYYIQVAPIPCSSVASPRVANKSPAWEGSNAKHRVMMCTWRHIYTDF